MTVLLFFTCFAAANKEREKKILIFFSGWSCKNCFQELDSSLRAKGIKDFVYLICDNNILSVRNASSETVKQYSGNRNAVIIPDSVTGRMKYSRKLPPCYLYEKYEVGITPALLLINGKDTIFIGYENLFENGLKKEYLDSLIASGDFGR